MPEGPRHKKRANRRPLTGKSAESGLQDKLKEREDAARKERALVFKTQGNEAFQAQDWTAAVAFFTDAIREDPSDHIFFSNRSAANLGLQRTADAVSDARECVQLEPKWPKGYSRLGAALWADRQLPEAIKAYEQGLQLDEANEAMQKSKADVEADLAAKLKSEVEEEEAAKQAQQPVVPLEEREPVIGIDLGTTYSAVAVWDVKLGGVRMLPDENGKNTVPSYVAWAEDGERVIGERAKAMAARLPGRVLFDVKRVIGRKEYEQQVQDERPRMPFGIFKGPEDRVEVEVLVADEKKRFVPEEISAMVLGKMKEIAERAIGKTVTKAVVTVPAYFNDAQRKATQAAGAIAGLDVLRIINEPTAAALGYGLDQKEKFGSSRGANVIIFDLGGGTFDVSVLKIEDGIVEVKATGGDTRLGGEDFDNALGDWISCELKKQGHVSDGKMKAKIKRVAENAKRELSMKERTEIEVSELVPDGEGVFEVTRSHFEIMCKQLFDRCFATVKHVLKDAKLDAREIDDVVLVGGSTRVPCIQQTLRKFFGDRELCKSIHPDEAVAYGAAVQGAILSGVRTSNTTEMLLIDVTPLSLGVETEGKHFSVIIPRNTSIPCSKSHTYTTTENYQAEIDVCVYEGERPCTDGNRLLGEFKISGIERAKKGEAQVDISFSLDANGVLQVTAQDKKTRARAHCTINNACKGLDPAEIARMVKQAEDMKEEDDVYREKIELRTELQELAYSQEKSDDLLEWLDGLDLGATPKSTLERKIRDLRG